MTWSFCFLIELSKHSDNQLTLKSSLTQIDRLLPVLVKTIAMPSSVLEILWRLTNLFSFKFVTYQHTFRIKDLLYALNSQVYKIHRFFWQILEVDRQHVGGLKLYLESFSRGSREILFADSKSEPSDCIIFWMNKKSDLWQNYESL